MSDALDDLRKARVAAVSHRRAYALKLAGVWASRERNRRWTTSSACSN